MSMCSRIKNRVRTLFHTRPTPRIMLFFVAVLIKITASALGGIGFVWNSPALMIAGTVVWLAWFAVLFVIAMPQADRLLRNQMCWLKPAAVTISVVFLITGLVLLAIASSIGLGALQVEKLGDKPAQLITSFEGVFAYNDATALCHQATENLIDGNNPYATSNVVTAIKAFNGSYDKMTPLREGSFAETFPYPGTDDLEQLWLEALENPEQVPPEIETKLGYPAGCFLLPAPFILLGIGDIRIVYLIFILPALAYVIWRAPRSLRLLLVGAILISLEVWNSVAGGETGSLCFPFLLLAWVLPKKHLWLSAFFMGIAVTTKQIAWFFMPFYLILIFRTMGIKRMLSVLAIVATIFLVTDIPFITSDPKLWLTSIMAPMIDNMFPLGVGIISLVSGGVLDIQSPLVFSVLEFVIGGLVIVWYFRNCLRYPHTGPLLAVLPLFFAWRSLWPYFFYIDIIMLTAIVLNEYGVKSPEQLKPAPYTISG